MSVWIDLQEGTELSLHGFDAEAPDKTIVVESRVNRGGSATIFTGRFKQHEREAHLTLALKVFSRVPSPEGFILLRRELDAARSLHHPYILPFLGVCVFESHTILISHFMKNGNLCDYIRYNPHADQDSLVLQVSRAVAFLHNEAQLVHGDLKCENVLVSDSGDALLADFGLSTSTEKPESETTTMTGIRILTTVQFCAPEILGVADVSAANLVTRVRSKTRESDIYAFGMLVLQAYTGDVPWAGITPIEIVSRVGRRLIPSRPDHAQMNNVLWHICKTCWAFEPIYRPRMHELVTVLDLLNSIRTPTDDSLLPSNESVRHQFLELGPDLQAVLAAHEAESLMKRVKAHLLMSPTRVLHNRDIWVLNRLLSTDSGKSALKLAPEAEKTVMAAMALYSNSKGSGDASNTVASATLEVLNLEAAQKNRDIYYSAAQPVVARARQHDPKFADKLEQLFAPAQVQRPFVHPHRVLCIAYTQDGSSMVSWCDDNAVRIWDIETGRIAGVPMTGDTDTVWSAAVALDEAHIALGSRYGEVRIWDIATGETVALLQGHKFGVRSVAFSPNGSRIASGSEDNTIRVRDVASTRTVVGPIKGHSNAVWSVAYSLDGTRIKSRRRNVQTNPLK